MTDAPAADAQEELTALADGPSNRRVRREAALVRELVDPAYYALTNADLLGPGEDPVEHFCRVGWRMLRKPNPDFDVWWYWSHHLDPSVDDVNPLAHYAVVGRTLGLSTRPPAAPQLRPGTRLPQDRPVRRACLFAGFDADGVVDDSVVLLLRELARHAAVFYLSDGHLRPEELAKLDGIVAGAWAVRHGAYDFGSYSLLAKELVGWDRLAGYDEVLFVNDSCFLVHPLDEVFEAMDARACDWWGLQATKGLASTRHNPRNGFTQPIPMDEVRERLLADYEDDPVYDFHLGSYFLAFRRPVLDDEVFRRLLDSVHRQPSKLVVILKYEIGLTHLLIGRGHCFETFVPVLHPFHPLFTQTHFRLLGEGFPLLKRYLIYQNHYDVPEMSMWKEKVLAVAPEAPVDVFERTLERTAPDDRLQRSMAITRTADGQVKVPRVVRGRTYERRDRKSPKRPDLWAFAVEPDGSLPDNSRAILEAVKDDTSVTAVVLTRSRRVALPGHDRLVVEPLLSPQGRDHLLHAGRIFVGSRARKTLLAPVTTERQHIVAVRGGLLLEPSGRAATPARLPTGEPDDDGPLPLFHQVPIPTISSLLVASDVDRLAALANNWPATFEHTLLTGLPAHDFLHAPEAALPSDLREQVARLRGLAGGRRLVLFAPVRRMTGSRREPYVFSESERGWLRAWSERNSVVIGVRPAPGDLERSYVAQLGEFALDLSEDRFPSVHAVLRGADAVLTDFSGAALDFAVTDRPVASFVHDLPEVREGLLYDLEHLFPGPVSTDFAGLEDALESLFDQPHQVRYDEVRSLLTDHNDAGSTARVLAQLESLTRESA